MDKKYAISKNTDKLWRGASLLWEKAAAAWKPQEGIREEIQERLKKGLPCNHLAAKAQKLAAEAREIERMAWTLEEKAYKKEQEIFLLLSQS